MQLILLHYKNQYYQQLEVIFSLVKINITFKKLNHETIFAKSFHKRYPIIHINMLNDYLTSSDNN